MQAMHMLHRIDMLQLSCTALHSTTACSEAASHSGSSHMALHSLH